MKKIAEFMVDHDILTKGMYVSRKNGDAITYDIRVKIPNGGNYLSVAEAHTLEHLLATYARNSVFSKDVIYVGPMGCMTGFYVVLRDKVSFSDAIKLIRECFDFVVKYEGKIAGVSKKECGNYLCHDLSGAKEIAKDMQNVLSEWTEEKLVYPA